MKHKFPLFESFACPHQKKKKIVMRQIFWAVNSDILNRFFSLCHLQHKIMSSVIIWMFSFWYNTQKHLSRKDPQIHTVQTKVLLTRAQTRLMCYVRKHTHITASYLYRVLIVSNTSTDLLCGESSGFLHLTHDIYGLLDLKRWLNTGIAI